MRSFLTLGLVVCALAARAEGQWTIDPKSSLAWWQLSPHLGHLWATTCPQDPAWQPGESRGTDSHIDKKSRKDVPLIQVDDPRVPIYPRLEVAAICSEAVSGTISATDRASWKG